MRGRVSDPESAEELTATAFIRAWVAPPSYDIRGVPFAVWLFHIARNSVTDESRCTAREVDVVGEAHAGAVADTATADEAVTPRCDAEAVRQAVSRLTDDQAAVIVLRFFWDMPISEVAEASGKTEGAVKAMRHRAVRMLVRLLSKGQATGRAEQDHRAEAALRQALKEALLESVRDAKRSRVLRNAPRSPSCRRAV